jgi:hypothetical protein
MKLSASVIGRLTSDPAALTDDANGMSMTPLWERMNKAAIDAGFMPHGAGFYAVMMLAVAEHLYIDSTAVNELISQSGAAREAAYGIRPKAT